MHRRITAAAALVAAVAASALLCAGTATAGPQPFDAPAPLASHTALGALLATPLFLPGEVDLATLGVPQAELATAGLSGAQASWDAEHNDGAHHRGAGNFVVDDDHAQCPNAQYSRIQDAVDAAPPGAEIRVCPGTYQEQVRIPKNGIKLFSERPWQAVIKAPIVMTYPNSVVTVTGASDVSVRQFTITGPYVAVDPGACAGLTDRHTGVRILNGSATIYGNHITQIRDADPALGGCQDGIGVLVGRQFEGQTGTAVLRNNLIDLYQKGGVVVDNAGSYAWVTQNVISGEAFSNIIARNGVQVGRGAAADVDHNLIVKNQFARLAIDDTAAGILLFETSAHVDADHNDVSENGVGIAVDEGSIGLSIDHNNVRKSINDGIAGFEGSSDNVIAHNKATDNTPYDCYDETVGPYGPSGTANQWIHNMGLTQNRPGLCKKAS
jgi:hypothetical protein